MRFTAVLTEVETANGKLLPVSKITTAEPSCPRENCAPAPIESGDFFRKRGNRTVEMRRERKSLRTAWYKRRSCQQQVENGRQVMCSPAMAMAVSRRELRFGDRNVHDDCTHCTHCSRLKCRRYSCNTDVILI